MSSFIAKNLYRLFEIRVSRDCSQCFEWLRETHPHQNARLAFRKGEMRFYSDQKIKSIVRVLAIILSSVLPILSIVVLYIVKSDKARLGLIVAFSAACSAALAILTNAKNGEIIAITAA